MRPQEQKTPSRRIPHSWMLLIATLLIGFVSPESSVLASEEPADPYAELAWLIGTWRGEFKVPVQHGGAAPEMTFAWNDSRDFIRYMSLKPDGTVEYEGMIVWHPVERRHVFLKSYRNGSRILMENGWIDRLPGGAVRFQMHTHYTEGDGLPWSDGALAASEGTTLRFRRTLTPDGEDRLWDDFVMRRGDKWEPPEWEMPVGRRGFEWKRIADG